MRFSANGIAALKLREACRLKAYRDTKGVWTIGWGTTGPGIHAGLVCTQAKADGEFLRHCATVEQAINSLVKVPLTQNQYDALVSFVYNIGVFNFQQSTMLRRLNALDYVSAAKEFKKWNHITNPRTGVLDEDKGLTNRRTAETVQFNTTESTP